MRLKLFWAAVIAALCCLPVTAAKFNVEYGGNTLIFEVWNATTKKVNLMGSATSNPVETLMIPERVSDGTTEYTVAQIYYGAFKGATWFQKVSFPETMEALGSSSFDGCTSLTEIRMPQSVDWIGEAVFSDCTSLKTLILSDNIDRITNWFCHGCTALTEIKLPENVDYISSNSFDGCTSLVNINIPDKCRYIYDKAFRACPSLRSIHFGSELVYIGNYAFQDCISISTVVIPAKVKGLMKYVFDGCMMLKTLQLHDNMTEIGEGAFRNCSFLSSVNLPAKLKTIGAEAFAGCPLNGVVIPNKVTSEGANAFSGVTGKCAYPANLHNPFGEDVAATAYNTRDVEVTDGFIFKNNRTVLVYAPATLTGEYAVPETVGTIGDGAFMNCKDLTSVIIPKSVTRIEDYAFVASGLRHITVPHTVTYMGSYLFSGCGDLQSATLTDALDNIPTNTFAGCRNLTEVAIPWNVKDIYADAFNGCESLSTIKLPALLDRICFQAFANTGLTGVAIPPYVQTIDISAFEGAKLQTASIGSGIREIGVNAFLCPDLKTVHITAPMPPKADNAWVPGVEVQVQDPGNGSVLKVYGKRYDNLSAMTNADNLVTPDVLKYEPGTTQQLTATVYPAEATLPHVFWYSTNPDVATVDNNGMVTYHENVNDALCEIKAVTMYHDGTELTFDIDGSVTSGIAAPEADTAGIDYANAYEVYNLNGVKVGDTTGGLAKGIYIVRQGTSVAKVAVK